MMMFFVLLRDGSVGNWDDTASEYPILGEVETDNYAACPWTEGMCQQMRYCQALNKDEECDLWNIEKIIGHRIRARNKKASQLEVKAVFKDPGKSVA